MKTTEPDKKLLQYTPPAAWIHFQQKQTEETAADDPADDPNTDQFIQQQSRVTQDPSWIGTRNNQEIDKV